jgi:O-antigen ligase
VFIGAVFELLSQKISEGSDGLNLIEQDGQKKLHSFELKKPDFCLIGFIFIVGIYFFVSGFVLKNDFALAFSSFKNYVLYSLFYFLVFFLMNKKEYIMRLFKFLFTGAVFLILFIVYGLATRHGLWSEFTPLSTEGFRTLAFTHAFYLGLAFLGFFTYLVFQEKKEKNGLYSMLIIIWSLGIAGSMMRHLWAGLAISAFVLYFLISGKQREIFGKIFVKYLAILLLAISVALYLSVILPYSNFSNAADSTQKVIEKRISSVFSASTDESFSWRSMVWTQGMAEYMKNPVFGLGLGRRIYVETEGYRDYVEVRNIHNSLLVLLFQFGLIPFVLFLAFISGNLKNIYQKADKTWIDVALIILLVYYLVVFLFQPYLETNMLGIFFWIILGLIAARSRNNMPRSEISTESHSDPRD